LKFIISKIIASTKTDATAQALIPLKNQSNFCSGGTGGVLVSYRAPGRRDKGALGDKFPE